MDVFGVSAGDVIRKRSEIGKSCNDFEVDRTA
jgi:hypothetical protein